MDSICYKIKLNGIYDIKDLVHNLQDFDISMIAGSLNTPYKEVNPKSLMGMLTLDLSNPILLRVNLDERVPVCALELLKGCLEKFEVTE